MAKVVHHMLSICAFSWGVYGGEKRRAICLSARNSLKCLLIKADPLSQLTTKGLLAQGATCCPACRLPTTTMAQQQLTTISYGLLYSEVPATPRVISYRESDVPRW